MITVEMQGAMEAEATESHAEKRTEAQGRLSGVSSDSPLMTPYRFRCDQSLFHDIPYLIESACQSIMLSTRTGSLVESGSMDCKVERAL